MNNELKNSEDFIKHKIHSNHGFSTPENYFDSVDDSVLASVIEQKFNTKNAFKTPENYFESFDDKLFSKLELPSREVKVISLKSRLLKMIPAAAAASILLFIGINNFLSTKKMLILK